MTTRLLITNPGWDYALQAAPQEPGRYYVTLRLADGSRPRHAAAAGPFTSLDFIQEHAVAIYLGLVARRDQTLALQP